jgi:hypothetical protein
MRAGRSSIGQAVATSSAVRTAGGELFGIAITMNVADDCTIGRSAAAARRRVEPSLEGDSKAPRR